MDERAENAEIIRMVKEDEHPPTNPSVLLRAARWAYLEGDHTDMLKCIGWLLNVEANNLEDLYPRQRDAARAFAAEMGAF